VASDVPEEVFRKVDSDWRSVPRIAFDAIRFVRRAAPGHLERVWALQALAGLAAALSVGATAVAVRHLLALDNGRSALPTLLPVVLAMTALALVGQVAAAYHTVNQEVVSEQVGAAALDRILDIAATVELEAFDDPAFRNRLEIAQTQAAFRPWQVVESVSNLTRALFTTVGVMVALVVLSPVTVLLVAAIVAPAAIVIGQKTQIEREFVRNRSLPERLRQSFVWRLNSKEGATDTRAHALAGEIRSRITALQREVLDLKRVARRRQAKLVLASNAGGLVIVGLTIAVVGWLFDRGRLSVPTAAAMLIGLVRAQGTIGFAGYSIGLLHEGALFLHDVEAFVNEARSRSTGTEIVIGAQDREAVERLRAEHVSFRYRSAEVDALHDVTLEVRSGHVLALVGANGSGKTTLAKLFAGLFRPTAGALLWDRGEGLAVVSESDLAALRGSTAIVSQNVHETRWPVTAHEHVTFGDITRPDDVGGVIRAATAAGAEAFVSELEHDWQTVLDPGFPNGTDLSGGQWQRLAIARAFFRDAPLIVLDEPTAALDALAEHDVFERVRRLATGKAVLLISHRFSTVSMADEIVVLEHGRVIEQGSHTQLMSIQDGTYAKMYTTQAAALLRNNIAD
jgi:ATP-binding cassette, subfamily B, bacterial